MAGLFQHRLNGASWPSLAKGDDGEHRSAIGVAEILHEHVNPALRGHGERIGKIALARIGNFLELVVANGQIVPDVAIDDPAPGDFPVRAHAKLLDE